VAEDGNQEVDRLKRHLRAMAVVNRQLQAQLEGGRPTATAFGTRPDAGDLLTSPAAQAPTAAIVSLPRGSVASVWLEQLQLDAGAGDPFLVRRSNGRTYVIEGDHRREVRAGLLAAALEQMLGPARDVGDDELERWTDSVPVEVLEGPKGAPFVVVGSRRLPIRGLPLPHPVSYYEMQMFPEGQELNVASANVSRARFEGALSGKHQVQRARAIIEREGNPVRGAAVIARRAARRLRQARKRSSG
jgi:hypothetical protein